jgi:hypothetical protein
VWEQTSNEQYLIDAWQTAEGALLFSIDRIEGITFAGEQARRESADLRPVLLVSARSSTAS